MISRGKTLIIAEAGVNHNGDIGLAHELIDAAADAGADWVKFQTFAVDCLVTESLPKAKYQVNSTGSEKSQASMLSRLELSPEMHESLIERCRTRGIRFFSTAFDIGSLNYLASIGAESFKVPSGEITNLPYLRHVGAFAKPVILSTGMATLGDIEAALEALLSTGLPRSKVTVLHCSTEYPAPMRDVNLRAMLSIGKALGVAIGYSDHTQGIEVPIAAVALGALVIEKHLTLNRDLEGPDHKASLVPKEFEQMVSAIRNIELAMGDGIKRPSAGELANKPFVRKSLVAARSIRAGELFTEENIAVKRAGLGISPMRWDEVIGRVAPKAFAVNEPLSI